MIVLSERYLQNPEKHTIELVLTFGIAPKTFRPFANNFHAQFGDKNNAAEFLNALNSQDLLTQYTIEYENNNKELNFLDVSHLNKLNHSYDFAVCCKTAITNV